MFNYFQYYSKKSKKNILFLSLYSYTSGYTSPGLARLSYMAPGKTKFCLFLAFFCTFWLINLPIIILPQFVISPYIFRLVLQWSGLGIQTRSRSQSKVKILVRCSFVCFNQYCKGDGTLCCSIFNGYGH